MACRARNFSGPLRNGPLDLLILGNDDPFYCDINFRNSFPAFQVFNKYRKFFISKDFLRIPTCEHLLLWI